MLTLSIGFCGHGTFTMHRTYLLITTAFAEGGIGILLLVWPSAVVAVLLGVDQCSPETYFTARIAGAALLAIGVACWLGRSVAVAEDQRGLITGVLVYDLAAAGLLGYAGVALAMTGIALWPAVVLHSALSIWCVMCLAVGPRSYSQKQEPARGAEMSGQKSIFNG
jgi:hypothetical protein